MEIKDLHTSLRLGLKGCQTTADGERFNLLWAPDWQGAFDVSEAMDVIDELERKAMIVAHGIDTFSKAEQFAFAVLLRHALMST